MQVASRITYLGIFRMRDINYGFGPKPNTVDWLVPPYSILQYFEPPCQHTQPPLLHSVFILLHLTRHNEMLPLYHIYPYLTDNA
jgi:hypothetical protein